MADSVKFIFRSLIKVPVIIMIVYIIMNIANFTINYIKLYSLSQVALNTAMENNYIPTNEYTALLEYADSITTNIMNDINISVETDNGSSAQNRRYNAGMTAVPSTQHQRVQYGKPVTVNVTGRFLWLLPIPVYGGTDGQFGLLSNGVMGMDETKAPSVVNNQAAMTAEMRRRGLIDPNNTTADTSRSSITFEYTVPGLKYYPDLDAS